MAGGLRDPDAPRVRKNVSFGHEEQLSFASENPSDFVGRAPAQMIDEGILEADTQLSRGHALRKRAFSRRGKVQRNQLEAAGQAFTKSMPTEDDPEGFADFRDAKRSERAARSSVAAMTGLPAYGRQQRSDIATTANASDTYRDAIAGGRGANADPLAQIAGMPGAQQGGGVGPQVSRAAQSVLPRTGTYAKLQEDKLRARFARANQADFGGSKYRAPQRYEGDLDEQTLHGTDELQTHVNLRSRFADQMRLQSELQEDARKGIAKGDASAADALWTGGGRGGRTPYGFTNASTAERPYFQSLDPTRHKFARDIQASIMTQTGNVDVNVDNDGGMGMRGMAIQQVQGPKAAPVDVSNAEDQLVNELDAKDHFTDNRAPQLLERQQQFNQLSSYIQRKSSKQEAKKGWKLFDPSTWFGHWGKNKRRAGKISAAQEQLQGLTSTWADQDATFNQEFSRFDVNRAATPRQGYQAPRSANPGLFTDNLAAGASRGRRGSMEIQGSGDIPEPADNDSDLDVDEYLGQVMRSRAPN